MLQGKMYERARQARDPRFDGRFFVGVRTTGIYCRPICPVKAPRRENVTFFPTAAAAGEAGYRPCLRCRPECAPGTPAWTGTSVTVRRGLRLIASGALDDGSVEQLADRLGVTGRHLRRLFTKHLGASPLAVAQTQRLHFAKRLIDETALPMSHISIAAGYSSVRRFNDAFARTYRCSPGGLRKLRTRADANVEARLRLRLPYRKPFDWDAILTFLSERATPGVEEVSEQTYRRTICVTGEQGILEIASGTKDGCLELNLYGVGTASLFTVVQRMRDLFDLDAPVADIAHALSVDSRLRRLLKEHPGIRVPGAWDGFELTVRAILGQQISVKAATTLAGRLADRYGEPLKVPGAATGLTRMFPTPQRLQRARLNGLGIIPSRAETIRRVADALLQDRLDFDPAQDPDQLHAALVNIKGVGDWTAQYVAMRVLKNPDAFPATDLALLKALLPPTRSTPAVMRQKAEAWRPWRAYAAMLMWSSLATVGGQ